MSSWIGLILSCVVAVVGVLTTFDWSTVISNPGTAGLVVTVLGGVSAVLHYFQTPAKKT